MNDVNTVGITQAGKDADAAAALVTDIGTGRWRGGATQPADLTALDSTMRPIDRLSSAGLGQYARFVQPFQDAIERMTGKSGAVRTFSDAWQRASTELDEATANLKRNVEVDTAMWAGEAAGAWRVRSAEFIQAMRGTAAAAKATAALAVSMGEAVAGARTEAGRHTDGLVDAIINLARASSAVQGGNTTQLLSQVEQLSTSARSRLSSIEQEVSEAVANFRTSSSSGLQHTWKRLGVWFGALPRDMVVKPPPTDAERGDLGRGGAYLEGSNIHLVPRNPGVPRVTLPNTVGAEGFVVGPRWDVFHQEHTYLVPTDTTIPFDKARDIVGEAIAEDPVPGSGDLTGRPEGVTNDAGAGNLVRSYTVPSPDPSKYTDITVNYTLGDEHVLQEGYVMRYGERMPDGTTRIVSYGEGNGIIQHPASPAHLIFNTAWEINQADIVKTVQHRMNMPPR